VYVSNICKFIYFHVSRPIVLSVEDGRNYCADFVLATLLDSNLSITSRNRTSISSNGITAPDHMTTDTTNTTHDLRPATPTTPPTSKPRNKRKKDQSIRDIEFPTGSQPTEQASVAQNITRGGTASGMVPPAPSDLELMDVDLDEDFKGHSPADQIDRLFGAETKEQAPDASVRVSDEFDVMDAIFGEENMTDVADNTDQFGLGVEGHVMQGISPKRSHDHSEVDTATQDSIINDSGFLPRSPPAKKVLHPNLYSM